MKNLPISDFKIDVIYGDIELEKLIELLGSGAKKGDGKIVDMYLNSKKYEIKTESRNILETGNVVYEVYSSEEHRTIGGPWKALENKIDYFWSWFPKNGIVIQTEPIKIVSFLENQLKSGINIGKYFKKKNKCSGGLYTTTGYAVSIEKLLKNHIVNIKKIM